MGNAIKLSDIERLDKNSLAEIEKTIEEYKSIRAKIISRLDAGKSFDKLLNAAKLNLSYWRHSFEDCHGIDSWREIGKAEKYLSILEQLNTSREKKFYGDNGSAQKA